MLVAGTVDAQVHLESAAIDQAVISKLSAEFGINAKVIKHLDLTQPFQTKSRWSLVAAKQRAGYLHCLSRSREGEPRRGIL